MTAEALETLLSSFRNLSLWNLMVPFKQALYVAVLASALFVCFGRTVSPFESGIFKHDTVI